METVYIETFIPSVDFERRTEPTIVACREWTRSWWDRHRHEFKLVTAAPVLEELYRGDHTVGTIGRGIERWNQIH